MTSRKINTIATAICIAPKKWVATLCVDGEMKSISGLEWNTRSQAKSESGAWLIMLQRSGRA
jgi:hypothetical protein